jgi:hypothetical protein
MAALMSMTRDQRVKRGVVTWLAAMSVAALAVGCDSLLTKPSLYGTVDVNVTRRNGDVIAGADLILYTGERPMGYGTTDSVGFHEFVDVPEFIYGVRAIPPAGYMRMEDLAASPPTDFVHNLQLQGGEKIAVRFSFLKKGFGTIIAEVTEPDGTPLAHVPVTLYEPTASLRSAVTDAAGRFAFDSILYGNYGVFATRSAAYLDSAETSFLVHDGIFVDEGSRALTSFVFVRCSGSISALVRDESGLPVPGSALTLYNSSRVLDQGPTGADGTRLFEKLGCEDHGVRVQPPIGWTAPEGRGTSFNDGLFIHRGSALTTTLKVQTVTCRATLRVRVADDAAVALGGVPITLYTSTVVYRNVFTGSDGLVVMDQIPCDREYGVRVTPPAGYTVVQARGSSFFDGILFTNGSVVERAFTLVRGS